MSVDGGAAAMKLNGVIVALEGGGEGGSAGARSYGARRYSAPGATITVRTLDDEEANWRANAELLLALDAGLRVGYLGFLSCGNEAEQDSRRSGQRQAASTH